MNRQRINTVLYHYCDKLGIERKSSHKIRKTYISNLIESEELSPADIIKIVGHEDYSTTLKSYCRSMKNQEAIDKILEKCSL